MNHPSAQSFLPGSWTARSDGPFLLRGRRPLYAPALGARLTPGPLASLAARSGAAFRAMDAGEGPALLVGAIPYDRGGEDALWRPLSAGEVLPAGLAPAAPQAWQVTGEPDAAGYAAAVAAALERLGPALPKVVLSRALRLSGQAPVDPGALMAGLAADPSVAAFITPLPAAPAGPARHMVGATPELLVSRRGREVLSNPLAGSAARRADPAADKAAAESLLGEDKDRREHGYVTEAVADALAPWCRSLSVPEAPALQSTRTMWHLGTRISGELKEDVPVAVLLAALHPTPAVCGAPREAADALLRALEGHERGFYAGAVGWMDSAGDGDWYITLRCAEVAGQTLRLHAGAGIVAGSDPAKEVAETSAKFLAMLRAIGVDESGQPLAATPGAGG